MGTDRRILSEVLVCEQQTYVVFRTRKASATCCATFYRQMIKFSVHFVGECPFFHPGLIELKSGIRGSLETLGPREIKKKNNDVFVCAQF